MEGQQEGQSGPILTNQQVETMELMRSMDEAMQDDLLAIARGLAGRRTTAAD